MYKLILVAIKQKWCWIRPTLIESYPAPFSFNGYPPINSAKLHIFMQNKATDRFFFSLFLYVLHHKFSSSDESCDFVIMQMEATPNGRIYCIGCWKCMDACPKQVLGKVKFLWHHHAKISNSDACIGCMKCVKVCPQHLFLSFCSQ